MGREDHKNILSYVDFSIICYVLLRFPELSKDFFDKWNYLFLFEIEKELRRVEKMLFDGLNFSVKQINTKKYNEYIITYQFLVLAVKFKYQVRRDLSVT